MTPTDLFKLTKIATIKKELLHVKEDAESLSSFFIGTEASYDIKQANLVITTIDSLLNTTKEWYERSLDGVDLDYKN